MEKGRYIELTENTPIYVNGVPDERMAVAGQIFEIIGEKAEGFDIRFGRIVGTIPKEKCRTVDITVPPKLTVAWLYGNNGGFDMPYNELTAAELGLDVISPTWFKRDGDPADLASIKVTSGGNLDFVHNAHQKGYQVWGLIADFNADRNYAVFTNEWLVDREIEQVVQQALALNLDGVNIDFEGFGSRCRDAYSRYVEKLSGRLKEEHFIVSIDVTKESKSDAWGRCYDRKEVAKYVDYVMFMAYDEHGRLDIIPGSTGSLPWVEEGIHEFLNMGIQKEKLLLGVPFYTRDWRVEPLSVQIPSVIVTDWEAPALYRLPNPRSEQIPISAKEVLPLIGEEHGWYAVTKNGQMVYLPREKGRRVVPDEKIDVVVKVEPLFSKDISLLCSQDGAQILPDAQSEQDKLTYRDSEGYVHRVWVENTETMEKRLDLMNKYQLGGMAAWALTQESPSMWEIIKRKTKRRPF